MTHLRLGYYAAIPAVPEAGAADGAMRYGAHTDYTGFTILRQDPSVGGLEAQTLPCLTPQGRASRGAALRESP